MPLSKELRHYIKSHEISPIERNRLWWDRIHRRRYINIYNWRRRDPSQDFHKSQHRLLLYTFRPAARSLL